MHKILVIHGPNLNLLGKREKEVYGVITLRDIDRNLKKLGKELGIELESFQSNYEGGIVEKIQSARKEGFDGILINPAAYTHTSVAIRDALLAVGVPFVEVHISNIFKREDFRHKSLISDIAVGVVCGFGINSYLLGLRALVSHISG